MDNPESVPEIIIEDSATTPPDDSNTDAIAGRKRERETSLEPSTPTSSHVSLEAESHRKTPAAKKNRTILSSTAEEDGSPPRSNDLPSLLGSPPGPDSAKLRQIRERVKHLNWKDGEETLEDADLEKDTDIIPDDDKPSIPETSTIHVPSIDQPQDTSESPRQNSVSPTPESPIDPSSPHSEARDKSDSEPQDNGDAPDTDDANNRRRSSGSSGSGSSSSEDGETDVVPPLRKNDSGVQKGSKDKSLKRKSRESSVTGPIEGTQTESHKRARDDVPAPKVKTSSRTKLSSRPSSPPPEPIKFGGFAAFSGPSPFTTVPSGSTSVLDKDPKSTPSKMGFASFTSSPFAKLTSPVPKSPSPESSAPSSPPSKQYGFSGFSAFSSKPSPFLSSTPGVLGSSSTTPPTSRGTIPKSGEAFGSFSNTPTRFGASDKLGSSSDRSKVEATTTKSFGDILASDKGNQDESHKIKMNIEEVDHHTGEELETTLQQTRAKLYTMSDGNSYKERGTGLLKVNVRKSDGRGARILMRAEGVFRLLLNANLFSGMPCSIGQDPKFIKLSTIEDGAFVHHAIKVGNAKVAQDLVDTIISNLPVSLSNGGGGTAASDEEEKESAV